MKRPTFILEGIGGVFNYGCEAQVRGTAAILRVQEVNQVAGMIRRKLGR